MNYQVWTQDEYEGWKKVDCGDLQAAQRELQKALLSGKDPLLTVEVPYDFNIRIKEDKLGEATKTKAKRSESPGPESKGEVRERDTGAVPQLSEGSRDTSPSDSVQSK